MSHVPGTRTEIIQVLETTLDDCSPQTVGYVLERALELGALDAYALPAQMKKGRPGVLLTLLCRSAQRGALLELLFAETPTLGVRARESERVIRPRELVTVTTQYGEIRVKASGDKAMPEYEDCRRAARAAGVALETVRQAAYAAWSASDSIHKTTQL